MLSEQTTDALIEALHDEYKARATYRAVIDAYGDVRPFINIVEAEGRHVGALLTLFDEYSIAVPQDDWAEKVTLPSSLGAACEVAVQAEIVNAAMYERLLDGIEEPDIRNVFRNLQSASRDRHLPAFRRCAARYQ